MMKSLKIYLTVAFLLFFIMSSLPGIGQKRVVSEERQEQTEKPAKQAPKKQLSKKQQAKQKQKDRKKQAKNKKKEAQKKKKARKKSGYKAPVKPAPQPAPEPAPKPAPVILDTTLVPSQELATDDSQAQFPGGPSAMYQFIEANLQYPEVAKQNNVTGRVVVGFFVDRRGAITNIRIEQSLSPECDAEAIRIVKAMPPWTPAKQDGLPVAGFASIPIVFILTK